MKVVSISYSGSTLSYDGSLLTMLVSKAAGSTLTATLSTAKGSSSASCLTAMVSSAILSLTYTALVLMPKSLLLQFSL
eukprot:09109.XXX_146677_146910_1 [CDS] Oithona nana genome sequencing.